MLAPEALVPVVPVQQHRQALVVETLLGLRLDTDLLEVPTEVVLTTMLATTESVEARERAETVAQGRPSREETAALVGRTCLVHHEAEEEAVTRTEMAEGPASRLVEARVAEMELTTTLGVIHPVLEQQITAPVEVRTGTNVEARMLVALES
jgi:hypothetical protein